MAKKRTKAPTARYREYLRAEREAVALYTAMAQAELVPKRAELFRELAAMEERHAQHWAEKLGLSLQDLPAFRPPLRTQLLAWLARWLGTSRVLPWVLRIEAQDTDMYAGEAGVEEIVAEEQGHSKTLEALKNGDFPTHAGEEMSWHRAASSGGYRAAVLGANDGLVTGFSLVWGVAGGTDNPGMILLAGLAGLAAGAFSMASGEYASIRAQRDLFEFGIARERKELEETPEDERRELSYIYQLKGLTKEEADIMANRIMQDPKVTLDTMAREELGLDPSELGSPWIAAISSFIAFSLGALVPVLPYMFKFADATTPFLMSGSLSGLGLVALGAGLALLSRKNPLWGGIRMLFIGMAAATVTFGIGRLVGVTIS